LEQQITDINYNVSLLMTPLNNKLGIFGEYGGSTAKGKFGRSLSMRRDVAATCL